MESKLFWPLDDDVFAGRVPTNHVVVFRAFEKAFGKKEWVSGVAGGRAGSRRTHTAW